MLFSNIKFACTAYFVSAGLVSSHALQAELAASVHRLAHEQAQHRESKAKAIDLARNNLLSQPSHQHDTHACAHMRRLSLALWVRASDLTCCTGEATEENCVDEQRRRNLAEANFRIAFTGLSSCSILYGRIADPAVADAYALVCWQPHGVFAVAMQVDKLRAAEEAMKRPSPSHRTHARLHASSCTATPPQPICTQLLSVCVWDDVMCEHRVECTLPPVGLRPKLQSNSK